MGRASVNTGASGRLTLDVYETYYNVIENYSDVTWNLYLEEASSSPYSWSGGGIGFTVGHHNIQQWAAGTFGYDFRPGGLQFQTIASGVNRVYHNADGTGQVTVGAHIDYTGTSAMGGPTDITNTIVFTTLKRLPNVPSNVAAVRVSDSQINLSWTNSGASNGQADSNQIYKRTNGGAWSKILDIPATNSAQIGGIAANQKVEFYLSAWNPAGQTGASAVTAPVYTTPAAPTNVTATKQTNLDITVAFDENVAYDEYNHEVWHGVVAGGVTTWDGAALATLASGVLSYTHAAPNAAQVHIYQVRAKQGALLSAYAQSNSVQLLIAPNKPTVPAMPAVANKAAAVDFAWVHNPIDTSPQTAYEFSYSTNGGTTWSTTGKVASTAELRTVAANAYAAGVALTTRVRTWGSATTGGSEGTGASLWSDLRTVTYKTIPTATITSPADGSTLNDATLRATLGFAQSEAATFVKAQIELLQGATLLETLESSNQVGSTFATPVQNGVAYVIRARVQDSNGLWSNWAENDFDVEYLSPVPAVIQTSYIPDKGWGQIALTIPAPGAGESAATLVSITRTIDDVTEIIVQDYPVAEEITFFDTTATIHGTNTYTVTTTSALGAQITVMADLVTIECRRAFLSKGPGFNDVAVFGANLSVDENLSVASAVVEASGRIKPIGLYGIETAVQLKVKSYIFEREGFSTIPELRAILLVPGKACFRDASGRRVFGSVNGSVKYNKTDRGDLAFTMTETS